MFLLCLSLERDKETRSRQSYRQRGKRRGMSVCERQLTHVCKTEDTLVKLSSNDLWRGIAGYITPPFPPKSPQCPYLQPPIHPTPSHACQRCQIQKPRPHQCALLLLRAHGSANRVTLVQPIAQSRFMKDTCMCASPPKK